ncbi:hypothetical protein [Streptomyces sp. NPDC047841]
MAALREDLPDQPSMWRTRCWAATTTFPASPPDACLEPVLTAPTVTR